MSFDLRPLLTFSFWLDLTPEPFLRSNEVALMAIFALWLLAGIIFRFVSLRKRFDPPAHRLFRSFGRQCLSLGVLGWILFWFSYERLPFLSMRGWYFLWAVGNIVWAVMTGVRFFRTARKERNAIREREARAKYLP